MVYIALQQTPLRYPPETHQRPGDDHRPALRLTPAIATMRQPEPPRIEEEPAFDSPGRTAQPLPSLTTPDMAACAANTRNIP